MKNYHLSVVILLFVMAGVALFTNVEFSRLMISIIAITGAGFGLDLFGERYRKNKALK